MSIRHHIPHGLLLMATAAAVSAFAATAAPAQEYTYSYSASPGYYGPPPEEVIIEAPRYHAPQRSTQIRPRVDVCIH